MNEEKYNKLMETLDEIKHMIDDMWEQEKKNYDREAEWQHTVNTWGEF